MVDHRADLPYTEEAMPQSETEKLRDDMSSLKDDVSKLAVSVGQLLVEVKNATSMREQEAATRTINLKDIQDTLAALTSEAHTAGNDRRDILVQVTKTNGRVTALESTTLDLKKKVVGLASSEDTLKLANQILDVDSDVSAQMIALRHEANTTTKEIFADIKEARKMIYDKTELAEIHKRYDKSIEKFDGATVTQAERNGSTKAIIALLTALLIAASASFFKTHM